MERMETAEIVRRLRKVAHRVHVIRADLADPDGDRRWNAARLAGAERELIDAVMEAFPARAASETAHDQG